MSFAQIPNVEPCGLHPIGFLHLSCIDSLANHLNWFSTWRREVDLRHRESWSVEVAKPEVSVLDIWYLFAWSLSLYTRRIASGWDSTCFSRRNMHFWCLRFWSSELYLKRWRASPHLKVSIRFNLSIEGQDKWGKLHHHIPIKSPEKLASTLFRVYSRHFSASSKEE